VTHETNGRKYHEALMILHERGEISSLKFVEASVVWKLAHSLVRERKTLWQSLRQSLRNLAFRLSFWKVRNHTVIVGLPPWDYRFLLYELLRYRNRLIYHTSWPSWHQSRVPRKLGILTPLLRSGWRRVLSGQGSKSLELTRLFEVEALENRISAVGWECTTHLHEVSLSRRSRELPVYHPVASVAERYKILGGIIS
jgi:hypothetical protein